MRVPRPERLILPVFLLPLAAAAALVLWARNDYLSKIEPYRTDGASAALRWIASARDEGRTAWLVERFTQAVPPRTATADGWASFVLPRAAGVVRVEGAVAPQEPWVLADAYPAGLRATALADANVRLAVESGLAPGRQDGADAGSAAFVRLVESPDAVRLRSAPLPASTKLYLLRRSSQARVDPDVEALTRLGVLQRLIEHRGGALGPGVHTDGDVVVLAATADRLVVWPDRASVPPVGPFVVSETKDGDARLFWSASPPEPLDGVAWTGHLDAPLAGEWTIELPHGDRWWESNSFTSWKLPAALACLAFLFVPTALLVALRRRRLLDEARARFVNELAHDLRTPVTSLRLHAEMLSEGRVPAGEEPRYLAVLGRETARLSSLLANLLDLSRLERGAPKFDVQPLDVAELAASAARDLVAVHPTRAADLTVGVAEGLAVAADRTALARCLANLLENAAKFTSAGTAIRLTADRGDAGRVRIVVADDGAGVAAADRDRIFELYERGADAAKRAAPGTGLGLALVRELVQGMGGRVTLLVTPRGAAFEILLPEAVHG